MKKAVVIILMVLSVFLLIGCDSADREPYNAVQPSEAPDAVEGDFGSGQLYVGTNRKIIYTVNIEMSTEDFTGTLDDLYAKIEEKEEDHNWIKQSEVTSEGDYKRASIVVMIKTDSINDFLDSVRDYGSISLETITSEDITYDYASTEAEISALTEEKAVYQALLAEPDNSTSETTYYLNQIKELNTQLAMLQDELTKYDNELEYSRVNITIEYRKDIVDDEPETFSAKIKSVFTGSLNAMLSFLKGILIVVLAILPFAFFGSVVLLIVFFSRKKYFEIKKRRLPSEKIIDETKKED